MLDCSTNIISLSPNNPSFDVPLLVQRNQPFSIDSSLQLNCSTSLATTRRWTIKLCTPSCTVDAQFEQTLTSMTLSKIYIPSKTLQYGLYQMNLTVRMSTLPELSSLASTYVHIIPSPIKVNLVQYGRTVIIHNQQQTLVLDPGRFSIDPDSSHFNSSVCLIDQTEIISNFLFRNGNTHISVDCMILMHIHI